MRSLHTNELHLQQLVTELNGKTLSSNKWNGRIGNMLDTASELKTNLSFIRISFPGPFVPMKYTTVDDIPTD